MNLLGLKTPSELGLIQYDSGSILVKRAAGDFENKSSDLAFPKEQDADHKTRFEAVTRTLRIGDLFEDNIYPVLNRAGTKQQRITIDPMLVVSSVVEDTYLAKLQNNSLARGDEDLKTLQKISYFYKKNSNQIGKVLKNLDSQFKLLVQETYEKHLTAPGPTFSQAVLSQERKAQLQPENLPSERLKSLLELIEEKGKERGIEQYSPKKDGEYAARKVEPVLNTDTIKLLLKAVKKQNPRFSISSPTKTSIYAANEAAPSNTPNTSGCMQFFQRTLLSWCGRG